MATGGKGGEGKGADVTHPALGSLRNPRIFVTAHGEGVTISTPRGWVVGGSSGARGPTAAQQSSGPLSITPHGLPAQGGADRPPGKARPSVLFAEREKRLPASREARCVPAILGAGTRLLRERL